MKNKLKSKNMKNQQYFIDKSDALMMVTYKITGLQIIALLITCTIGIILTNNHMYWQQLLLIPLHILFMLIVVLLNKKWCKQIDLM